MVWLLAEPLRYIQKSQFFDDSSEIFSRLGTHRKQGRRLSPNHLTESGLSSLVLSYTNATKEPDAVEPNVKELNIVPSPVDYRMSLGSTFENVKENNYPVISDFLDLKSLGTFEDVKENNYSVVTDLLDLKSLGRTSEDVKENISPDGSDLLNLKSLGSTIEDVKENISPVISNLTYLKSQNSTVDDVKKNICPIISDLPELKKPPSPRRSPITKPKVRFTEPPPVTKKFAVPQHNSKIPSKITVNGRVYIVKDKLGTGGSSVVYEVNFLILFRYYFRMYLFEN